MKDAGQLTVELPDDLHAELHAEAERHGWSISELVRIAWRMSAPEIKLKGEPGPLFGVTSRPFRPGDSGVLFLPEPRHLCTFDVPIATPSLTNQREKWQARHKRVKAQRKAVWACAPALLRLPGAHPFTIAIVDLTRHAPSPLDSDNCTSALKAVRDEVARMLGCDDRDPRVVWRYAQAQAKKPSVGISIAVRR